MERLAQDARLAKYRVIRLLGSGGMGDVYLAHDSVLNRDVAIKLISPERIDDLQARRWLIREARAAAALDHPCICAVYEVHADSDGPAFIAMQYVEGETLAARLRKGALAPREALALFEDIADALTTAHRNRVVHRDLKPENIILTPSARPKLLDFGIARVAATPTEEPNATTCTQLTGEGDIVGTPGYMSPEQIEGKEADARSDLFSLGCVLFESLTGQPAFAGRTRIEVCAAVLHVPAPAPSSIRPELTDRFDELCRRLLAKDPRERFQSAEEVLGAIRALQPSHAVHAQPPPPSPVKRSPWRVALLAASVALIVAAGWVWQTRRYLFETAPPAEAVRWYERGSAALRDGTYDSARRALQEALRVSADFPQAYVRLAEAHSELDQESEAKDALLSVDRTRLPPSDRVRLDALTASTTGRLDDAVLRYRELVDDNPSDASLWLDLGRAQEASGHGVEARQAYERASELDPDYAAAHMRLGLLHGQQGRRDLALKHLDQAERLYRAASHVEGETEALLRRGVLLAGANEFSAAKSSLERALAMASGVKSRSQEIRAQLATSSLTAAEGRLGDAEVQARAAVRSALEAGLDVVAANGLIDLAGTLILRRQYADATRHLTQARELAERRRAPRTELRARLTLASVALDVGRQEEAIALSEATLEPLRARGYRRWELTALSIASRAYEYGGNYERARAIAQDVLRVAETLQDDSQITNALENLAGQAMAQGLLPDALDYRRRSGEIHTRQGDMVNLAFDFQNEAELLIRLGRGEDAERLLAEIDKRAAAGVEAFASRRRRVEFLRSLRAIIEERFSDAARMAVDVLKTSGPRWDGTAITAAAMLEYAIAAGAPISAPIPTATERVELTPRLRRDVAYWELSTLVARRRYEHALVAARSHLADEGATISNELSWRTAALGAVAAQQSGDAAAARQLTSQAAGALEALKPAFREHLETYLRRPDLVRLRKAALNAK